MVPLLVATVVACTSVSGRTDDGQSPDGNPDAPPGGGTSGQVDTTSVPAPEPTVVINELVAANDTVLTDADGDTPDWIELLNASDEPIDLEGYRLTDDDDDPDRFIFPPEVLVPGQRLLVYASGKGRATPVLTWDTRIDQGDAWRYLAGTAPVPSDWAQPSFDDSAWATGPSGFGRGDSDDATVVEAHTVYARTTFDLSAADLGELVALVLHLDYDDGFVAWLNGVEVVRRNLGIEGTQPVWDDLANAGHEAVMVDGGAPERFDLDDALGLLVEGENVLAIEVHDYVTTSSDISLIPFLTLGFETERTARTSTAFDLDATRWHTPFQLSAEGEEVLLYDAAGNVVDRVRSERLYADWSYGRQPDGTGALGYFQEPTPGTENVTESRPGFAEPPVFAPAAGRYPNGTDVELQADSAAEIRYAWGGYEPTEADPVYTAPLPTGTQGDAVVLRARAFQDGLWPSRIATATYLLREPGPLPVVSLVTDPPNLWDEEIGIFAFGDDYEPEAPYHGANFQQDWERPIHVEQWELDGTLGFSVDGMVEVHGGRSVALAQKGLRIEMSAGHGEPSIEHDVFPGLGITSFKTLLLRSGGQDWLGCSRSECSEGALLRDPLVHELAAGLDVDGMAYRPAEAYVNGEYWGIYNFRERVDEHYIAAHHGEDDVDILERQDDVVQGELEHYTATLGFMRTHDLSDPANYAVVRDRIDVDELQTYIALQIWADNTDWPANNIKFWHPRRPDGRWRWLLYDTDFGVGSWGHDWDRDTVAHALEPDGPSWPNPSWSTELFRLLVTSPEFTDEFLNRYADLLNTRLSSGYSRAKLAELADTIAPEVPRHWERWRIYDDGVTRNELGDPDVWADEVDWMDEWLTERPYWARQHLLTHFGLAGTWTLQLDADPPGSGTFQLTALEVEAPFTGEYFLDVPVTVTAVPAPGYAFDGWSDPTLPATPTVTLDPLGPVTLEARFR